MTTDSNTTDTSNAEQNSTPTISRHAGTGVGGFIVGGGYHGKRTDQDDAVQELAERLSEAFPEYNVQIRFNTNRLSGGAWLVDTEQNAQVGLGAALCPPEWHQAQQEAYIWGDAEEEPPSVRYMDADELDLRYTVKLETPAVAEHRCNRMTDRDDRDSYLYKKFHTLDAAWGYFEFAIEREHVNPPGEV